MKGESRVRFVVSAHSCSRLINRPYTPNPLTGDGLAFIYDPWGTYIELNERKKPL
jgi:hypothetical protein